MQVLHFVLLGRQLQVCLLSVLISLGLWEFKHLVFFPFEQQQGYLEFLKLQAIQEFNLLSFPMLIQVFFLFKQLLEDLEF